MPKGIPVATFAIGEAGAANAGLFAVSLLAGDGRGPRHEARRLPREAARAGRGDAAARRAVILPGATLGLLGGGQLGRMFTVAARTLGYRVTVLDPDPALARRGVRHRAPQHRLHAPGVARRARADLRGGHHRVRERPRRGAARARRADARAPERERGGGRAGPQPREGLLRRATGCPSAPSRSCAARPTSTRRSPACGSRRSSRRRASATTARARPRSPRAPTSRRAFADWKRVPCVLEELLALELEISVILARAADGEVAVFPVAENRHAHGILDVTIAPARIPDALAAEATALASRLAAGARLRGRARRRDVRRRRPAPA